MLFEGFILFILCIFYAFDGYAVVKHRCSQIRQVYKLSKTVKGPVIKTIQITISLIMKHLWINFLQWANNTVEYTAKTDTHTTVILTFSLEGKLYRLPLKIKKSTHDVLMVLDQDDNVVNDIILPFMGPNHDWYGLQFDPEFWQKKKLLFELSNGTTKVFEGNDLIVL